MANCLCKDKQKIPQNDEHNFFFAKDEDN